MNSRCYRLVQSRLHEMKVPVPECARSHSARGKSPLVRMTLLATLLAAGLGVASAAPTIPAGLVPQYKLGQLQFTNAALGNSTAKSLVINQTAPSATLNWDRFNLAAGESITFNQRDSTWIALNRIFDQNASTIFGSINARGQVYLLNQNGILFGKHASVNVGSLLVSTLDLSPTVFKAGILSARDGAAAFTSVQGSPGSKAYIQVDAGANITTASGGKVMMFAPVVSNAGSLSAPDGQVILAAGQKVYLAASSDPNVRGIVVEVDNDRTTQVSLPASVSAATTGTGTVTNAPTGRILSRRGNVAMVGLAVNQSGLVFATTSVNANGSVYLRAQSLSSGGLPPVVDTATHFVSPTEGGTVTLGSGSSTVILPESNDPATLTDLQTFRPSVIVLKGDQVRVASAARVVSPNASMTLEAILLPGTQTPDNPRLVLVDPKALIDLSGIGSGSTSTERAGEAVAQISMSRNSVAAQLRGPELANSPLLRSSFLRGQTVYFDVRANCNGQVGTCLADVSGYASQIGRTVLEKMATGGTLTVNSTGNVLVQPTATVDLSGGRVEYLAGYLKTTQLISNGQVVDISVATPDRAYSGFADRITRSDPKWGVTRTFNMPFALGTFEQGYTQGASAGQLSISAPSIALAGRIKGAVIAGALQRTAASRPLGASLSLGSAPNPPDENQILNARVLLGDMSAGPVGDTSLAQDTLLLGADQLSDLSVLSVNTNGTIRILPGQALAFRPGASLSLWGSRVSVERSLSLPGGSLTLKASATPLNPDPSTIGITVADGVRLDLAGRWVNDAADLIAGASPAPVYITGGKAVFIALGSVTLGQGSVIDVSGGGQLKSNGSFSAGAAGSITLQSNRDAATGKDVDSGAPRTGTVVLGGALRAYSAGVGGSLTLSAGHLTLGGTPDGLPGELVLDPTFFQTGGFTQYSISGLDRVVVTRAVIQPLAQTYQRRPDARFQVSGTALDSVFQAVTLAAIGAPVTRAPTSISLRASRSSYTFSDAADGSVRVDAQSSITVDPGASINLSASHQVSLLGTLRAPGGLLSLTLGSSQDVTAAAQSGTQVIFDATQAIILGNTARVDAAGVGSVYPDATGAAVGSVFTGGRVNIAANQGYLITQAGSLVDVSGGSAVVDLPLAQGLFTQRVPTAVGSNAGSISLSAREGILLAGRLRARAGSSGAAGGTLSLSIDRADQPGNDAGALSNLVGYARNAAGTGLAERVLVLTMNPSSRLPAGLGLGDGNGVLPAGLASTLSPAGVETSVNGMALVPAAAITAGGFDRVSLMARDRIVLGSNLEFAPRISLTLDTPLIQAAGEDHSAVSAWLGSLARSANPADGRVATTGYVELRNSNPVYQSAGLATPPVGGSTLDVQATQLVDLTGSVTIGSVASTRLSSGQDIRFNGVEIAPAGQGSTATALSVDGRLASAGDIAFLAQQVYPSTNSNFRIDAPGAQVSFAGSGGTSSPFPLSAGGSLTVSAAVIDIKQGAVLRAPLGTLSFDAAGALTLAAGSLTSVSADGHLIPYGSTQNGNTWIYAYADFTQVISTPPTKAVELTGASVTVNSGARVDVSGGGNLYAYEFSPGPGGSRDVLAASTTWAVLPGFVNGVAPRDFQYGAGSGLGPGDSVYLSGAPGLPAGTYTLLPAHYALLPGGFALTAVAGTTDRLARANQQTADGSSLIAGYRAVAGTPVQDARSSGFLLTPGVVLRSQSQFNETSGNGFFAAAAALAGVDRPRLPQDAGRFAVQVKGSGLTLDGQVAFAPGTGGLGGQFDLVAPRLRLVDDLAAAPTDTTYFTLSVDQLLGTGVSSLLLGGWREAATGSGQRVDVLSTDVLVANSSAHPLAAAEVLLVASGKLTLAAGAAVKAEGVYAGSAPSYLIGPGALLRLSTGGQAGLLRSGSNSQGGAVLLVDPSARLSIASAGGSIIADATGTVTLQGSSIQSPAGAALRVGSAGISFAAAGVTPASTGVVLNATDLQALALSDLSLVSYGTVDFYTGPDGKLQVGGASLRSLQIDAAGLVGHGGGVVTLQAASLRLGNTGAGSDSASDLGTAQLRLVAGNVELFSAGSVTLQGFTDATVDAAGQILASGAGSFRQNGGSLSLLATRITAGAGSSYRVEALGALRTGFSTQTALSLPANTPGGSLTLKGPSIEQGGNIDLPAGLVSLEATTGDIVLDAGSRIAAGGFLRQYQGTTAAAAAGRVALTADQGSVGLLSGAVVDVSAQGGADAGQLILSAVHGTVQLDGTLHGAAVQVAGASLPALQGSLSLDLGSMAGTFGGLAQAGAEFTQAFSLRLRSGDLTLNAGVTAQNIDISLDDGNLAVVAKLDATGAKGGQINLFAGQQNASGKGSLTLETTAVLNAFSTLGSVDANGSGTQGAGGNVTLGIASSAGNPGPGQQILLKDGARIDVHEATNANPGQILLRAPRLNAAGASAGDGVAVSVTGTPVLQAGGGEVVVEAVKTYAPLATVGGVKIINTAKTGVVTVGFEVPLLGYSVSTKTTQVTQTTTTKVVSTAVTDPKTQKVATTTKPAVVTKTTSTPSTSVATDPGLAADAGSTTPVVSTDTPPATVSTTSSASGNSVTTTTVTVATTTTTTATRSFSAVYAASPDLDADNRAFMSNAPTILGAMAIPNAHLRPGVEVVSSGDMTVSVNEANSAAAGKRGWNLADWRYSVPGTSVQEPGVLTLRAAGDLSINGSITDGFSAKNVNLSQWALQGGDSWSYRFTGGAALAAANPLATLGTQAAKTQATKGSVIFSVARTGSDTDPALSLVRTGNGFINVSAALDVRVNSGAAVYTAGVPDATLVSGAFAHRGGSAGNDAGIWPTQGGAIRVSAGRDVVGTTPQQLVGAWLSESGVVNTNGDGTQTYTVNPAWWPVFSNYHPLISGTSTDPLKRGAEFSFAALGGGDVSVVAGGNLDNLSAAVVSNGRLTGTGPGDPTQTLVVRGGGDLSLRAGQDVISGVFYVGLGAGRVSAGGAISGHDLLDGGAVAVAYPIVALGQGQVQFNARNSAGLETVYAPTALPRGPSAPAAGDFFLYGATSGIAIASAGGDVVLDPSPRVLSALFPKDVVLAASRRLGTQIFPGTLTATAFSGDVVLNNSFDLAPSATGNLRLLAQGSVQGASTRILMADADPSQFLPIDQAVNANNPNGGFFALVDQPAADIIHHAPQLLHAGDTTDIALGTGTLTLTVPVQITANTGDVVGSASGPFAVLPKRAEITAGRDIRNLTLDIQHVATSDVTTLSAGRDVLFDTARGPTGLFTSNTSGISVGGPGQLLVMAGRNIDLGNAFGITSLGNLENPFLPDVGAAVTTLAGTTAMNTGAFASRYLLDPKLTTSAGHAQQAADYLSTLVTGGLPALAMTPSQASGLYAALPATLQSALLAQTDASRPGQLTARQILDFYATLPSATQQSVLLLAGVASPLKLYQRLPTSVQTSLGQALPATDGEALALLANASASDQRAALVSAYLPTALKTYLALPAALRGDLVAASGGAAPASDTQAAALFGLASPRLFQAALDLHELAAQGPLRVYQGLPSGLRSAVGGAVPLPATDAQALDSLYGLYQVLPATQQRAVLAFGALTSLPVSLQLPLLGGIVYQEARMAGAAAVQTGPEAYQPGYDAISTLFGTPAAGQGGNLNVFFSQIKTIRGGDINLFTPFGSVNAGVINTPADLAAAKGADLASVLGIVADRGLGARALSKLLLDAPLESPPSLGNAQSGSVNAVVGQDFLVNTSRVFTLAGGDILLWASQGNIDAGKGAKTAASAPPPLIRTDANGNTEVDLSGVVSGSGIGELLTVPGTPAGDVSLIAPKGEVNAGDAGIRAAGNLTIAALRVVGAENIAVGGVSVGVPVTVSTAVSASVAGAAASGAGASRQAEQATQSAAGGNGGRKLQFRPSFITVDVVGLGDEDFDRAGSR